MTVWQNSRAAKEPALVQISRMDGAWLGSVDIAIKKARTAALFNMPTGDTGTERLAQPGGPLYNAEASNNGLITGGIGGKPIRSREGRLVGAVGVAGASETRKDEEVVRGAFRAIRDMN